MTTTPQVLSGSNVSVGEKKYHLTTTTNGVVLRRFAAGSHKYDKETGIVAAITEAGIVWKRESRIGPDMFHYFDSTQSAVRFATVT